MEPMVEKMGIERGMIMKSKRSKRHSTVYKGVFFRESTERKHNGKPDRYFLIRYRIDGKAKEEGLGWASEIDLNAKKASLLLAKLKLAQVAGTQGRTLQERRQIAKDKKEAEKAKQEQEKKDQITFADVFEKHYLPQCKADMKKSCNREESLFRLWIDPVIGQIALKDVSPIILDKVKKRMRDEGQSPRSIQYALSTIRQTFNFAKGRNFFDADNPVKKIKMPKFDNVRRRFLTRQEADKLLDALEIEDVETWQMALISLHCGLRASEIFALEWIDINTQTQDKTILIRDAKGGTRVADMTERIRQLFLNKKPGKPHDLIYPGPDGKQRREIPATFKRIVEELGLNAGITDRRQKIVFHSLRHTFASWLLESGEDIVTVQKMGGWKTLSMAGRYTHIFDHARKRAVNSLERFLESRKKDQVKQEPASKVLPIKR